MPPAYRLGKPRQSAGSGCLFLSLPRAYALGEVRSPAGAGSKFGGLSPAIVPRKHPIGEFPKIADA